MRNLFAAFTFWLALSGAALADIPRPETLTDTLKLMQQAVLESGLAVSVTVDEDEQSLIMTSGDDVWISHPDNLHLQLRAAETEAERAAYLQLYVATWREQIETKNVTPKLEQLLPVIRHETLAQAYVNDMANPVSFPFVGELRIFLVIDQPASMSYVTASLLEQTNWDIDKLLPIARENLLRNKADFEVVDLGGGQMAVFMDQNYESSLLLDDTYWNQQVTEHGRVLAVVPARDLLLFYIGRDPYMARHMYDRSRLMMEGFDHAISAQVMQWTGGAWTVVEPE